MPYHRLLAHLARSVTPDNFPKSLSDDAMIYRWVATVDVPDFGIQKHDCLAYNPESQTPFTITRAVTIDPGALLNLSVTGALSEMPPFDLPRPVPVPSRPPLRLLRRG
jgi:hypothetical protein